MGPLALYLSTNRLVGWGKTGEQASPEERASRSVAQREDVAATLLARRRHNYTAERMQ